MEVKVLTQGKESAEKQIKSMGCQMAMSLDSYKKGYDDILARKEKEFDGRMQLVNKQVNYLKLVGWLLMYYESCIPSICFCLLSSYVQIYGTIEEVFTKHYYY